MVVGALVAWGAEARGLVLPGFVVDPSAAAFDGRFDDGLLRGSASRVDVLLPGGEVVVVEIVGGDPSARLEGSGALSGTLNDFRGNDPSRWRRNMTLWSEVSACGVLPGIDVSWRMADGLLELDFLLAPGADADDVELRFRGGIPRVDADGELVVAAGTSELRQRAPIAWEQHGAARVPIRARWITDGDRARVRLAAHDAGVARVIDPIVSFATYLGGGGEDLGYFVGLDAAGNSYVAGLTDSVDFPAIPGPPPTLTGTNAFVTVYAPDGQTMLRSTIFGGSGSDEPYGFAVAPDGSCVVTGRTFSDDFPTANAAQGSKVGYRDAFITRFDASGAIAFSTYLGGARGTPPSPSYSQANDVAIDAEGRIAVLGMSNSPDFPSTPGAERSATAADDNLWIGVFDRVGAIQFLALIGGSDTDGLLDHGGAVAFAPDGTILATGASFSDDFPTLDARQGARGGNSDPVLVRVNGSGALLQSTYLGGPDREILSDIAFDACGNIHLCGFATSGNMPAVDAVQAAYGGGFADGYFMILDPTAQTILQSSFFGDGGNEKFWNVDFDGVGNRVMVGMTEGGSALPVRALRAPPPRLAISWIVRLDPTGHVVELSTPYGLDANNFSMDGIADARGSAWFTGATDRAGYPVVNAIQPLYAGGGHDVVLARIDDSLPSAQLARRLVLDADGDGGISAGDDVEFTLSVTNEGVEEALGVVANLLLPTCLLGFAPPPTIVGDAADLSRGPVIGVDGGLVRLESIGGVDGLLPDELVTATFVVTIDPSTSGDCCVQADLEQSDLTGMRSDDPATCRRGDATCLLSVPVLELSRTVTDADLDGCMESGETITVELEVRVVGGMASNVVLLDTVTDANGVVGSVDAGSGTWTDPVVSWLLGPAASGDVFTRTWTFVVPCDAADRAAFALDGEVRHPGGPLDTDAWTGAVANPVLDVVKSARFFDDDGDTQLDSGESVAFDVSVTNTGSCAAPMVVVTDDLDGDLDAASAYAWGGTSDGLGHLEWDASGTPSLASIAPGATVTVTGESLALALLPGDPTMDGRVENLATAIASHPDPTACDPATFPPVSASDSLDPAEVLVIQTQSATTLDLLRNVEWPGRTMLNIFSAASGNTTTCGRTSLDRVADLHVSDVGSRLASGLVLPGEALPAGAPLAFYEVTERCHAIDGGADTPTCKTKAGSNLVLAICP